MLEIYASIGSIIALVLVCYVLVGGIVSIFGR